MARKKSAPMPQHLISHLLTSIVQDPLLPRPNPTEAFWQLPPSKISQIQSPKLPSTTTYAIIGSGITACSVATNLLSLDPTAHVTVLEARNLCSGATGRNGGHLLSPIPEEFCLLEKHFGTDETVRMARFANRTLEQMYALGEEFGDAAEVRRVRTVTGYRSQEGFEEAKRANERYEECVEECKGDFVVGKGEDYNMKDVVGVVTNSAGAFWPYRLITGLFERLLEKYAGRFSLETHTPVTNIEHSTTTAADSDHPYTLTTPRGPLHATKVIHCSNGWTGHLLPNFRGKIFPLRGTMSTQRPGSKLPHIGAKHSWSTIDATSYDPENETASYGLYYITQNEETGDVYVGGENVKVREMFSSDDTTIDDVSRETLEGILPTVFKEGWEKDEKPEIRKLWSGVMGFTPDHVPWVGQIPRDVTKRDGQGEYIAAGFNGYGMPMCWGCGEAVAKIALGQQKDVDEWLPKSFLISESRLGSPYSTPEAAIAVLTQGNVTFSAKACLAWSFATGYVRKRLFG